MRAETRRWNETSELPPIRSGICVFDEEQLPPMTTILNSPESVQSENSISAYATARSTVKGAPLSPDERRKIDAYWRASLYLCMGWSEVT